MAKIRFATAPLCVPLAFANGPEGDGAQALPAIWDAGYRLPTEPIEPGSG